MAETVLDQILDDLRGKAVTHYPQRGEFKNLRVVGHTPKNDHFIYDVCIDFGEGSERVAIKIYRPGKCGANAKSVARQENANLQYVNQTLTAKKKHEGIPRFLGDYSDLCAVVTDKVAGLPVQSIIMKAALLPGFADNGSIALVAQRAGERRGLERTGQRTRRVQLSLQVESRHEPPHGADVDPAGLDDEGLKREVFSREIDLSFANDLRLCPRGDE